MTGTKTSENKIQTFDLNLTHADFVALMNDSDVVLSGSDVDADQEFILLLKKNNGSEINLTDMITTDTLVVRFKKVIVTTTEEEFDNIDVS